MEDDRVASSKEGGRADWKKNLTLLLYVVLVIVFGTTNRVTFKVRNDCATVDTLANAVLYD